MRLRREACNIRPQIEKLVLDLDSQKTSRRQTPSSFLDINLTFERVDKVIFMGLLDGLIDEERAYNLKRKSK